MSIVGHRGSSESGWRWRSAPSRGQEPPGPRRPLVPPPLLPLGFAAIVALVIAVVVVAGSRSGGGSTPSATPTHEPSPTATAPPPTPTVAVPTPTATLEPIPEEPAQDLAVWDGRRWRFDLEGEDIAVRAGEVVPFLLRVEGAIPGNGYGMMVRYTCRTLAFLTGYDRAVDARLAAAEGGPGAPLPDSSLAVPDDPGTAADDGQTRAIGLWGGTLAQAAPLEPVAPCQYEKRWSVSTVAHAETMYLLWSAYVAPEAYDSGMPLRLTVFTSAGTRQLEVPRDRVLPPQP